jgi:hypothetical protein
MLAAERLLQIENLIATKAARIVALEIDGGLLRLIIYFQDKSNLRVTEYWAKDALYRYSYYWLTPDNELEIGWDNAPHHTQIESFPHHKHVGQQSNLQPSQETTLEAVLSVIFARIEKEE